VEAAVGSPWEAAGSHTAEVGVGRSQAVAGIGLGEGCCHHGLVNSLRYLAPRAGAIAKELIIGAYPYACCGCWGYCGGP